MTNLVKKLTNQTYKLCYWIVVADTFVEGMQALGKKLKVPVRVTGAENLDNYGAVTLNDPIAAVIYTTAGLTYSVIAHESFHLTDNRLSMVGMELVSQSCEAYAYLLDEIVENTIGAMRKAKVKIKDK